MRSCNLNHPKKLSTLRNTPNESPCPAASSNKPTIDESEIPPPIRLTGGQGTQRASLQFFINNVEASCWIKEQMWIKGKRQPSSPPSHSPRHRSTSRKKTRSRSSSSLADNTRPEVSSASSTSKKRVGSNKISGSKKPTRSSS